MDTEYALSYQKVPPATLFGQSGSRIVPRGSISASYNQVLPAPQPVTINHNPIHLNKEEDINVSTTLNASGVMRGVCVCVCVCPHLLKMIPQGLI